MIDPRDPGTQQLQLEQKRGRGRPATGQALSNAERQRRYREAQKAQRNENMHKEVAEGLRDQLAKALEEIEFLNRKNTELLKQLRKQQDQLAQRNEKPARVKRHRDQPAAELPEDNDLGPWKIEFKVKGDRKWCDGDTPMDEMERAITHVEQMRKSSSGKKSGTKWRAVSPKGLVYSPDA